LMCCEARCDGTREVRAGTSCDGDE
jgi:hypothetical protein